MACGLRGGFVGGTFLFRVVVCSFDFAGFVSVFGAGVCEVGGVGIRFVGSCGLARWCVW